MVAVLDPTKQMVFGEFQAKNLASSSKRFSGAFQEMKHQTVGTKWPSGNILILVCKQTVWTCNGMEAVLQGCGDVSGSFCTVYYFLLGCNCPPCRPQMTPL